MNNRSTLATAAAVLAAGVGLAVTLAPGAASATDFIADGTCSGAAVLHQTKGVAHDLHTWQYTVNGLNIGTNISLEGITIGGHPGTVTLVGRYWRKPNADTTTREDATTTITRQVSYPTNCATPPPPPPPPASTTTTVAPPATTVPPNVTVCDTQPELCQPQPEPPHTTTPRPALPPTE